MNGLFAPKNLRAEYRVNPIGIDIPAPRLSWEVNDNRRGAIQAAYQVLVASSAETLGGDQGDLWDSDQVESGQSLGVVYGGQAPASRQRVWWKVRTWDTDGQPSPWSQPAYWEMGLLAVDEWKAMWIGSHIIGGQYTSAPAPFLRTSFEVEKPIAAARLYVTALGLYECYINGGRVGDARYAPGWTDYTKRVQYQVYDVSEQVSVGENALGAILGDGWYCGYIGWRQRQAYGDQPRFMAQLMIDYADGSTKVVATDETWLTDTGPILEADNMMGESYDARLEMAGWNDKEYDDSEWLAVRLFEDPGISVDAMRGPLVRAIQEITPIADPKPHHGGWLFDLGQNMVGHVRLKVKGHAGQTVTIRHAEILDEHGNPYYANLREARATDRYTLRGGAEEVWEPRFTFHGFRYVELTGFPGTPTRDTVTGVVVHSDTAPTGSFECSEPLINQLQHNITWGQKGNFLDIPTDCPQRNERLGWTGDAQVFVRTAAFNMDVAGFFAKWVRDTEDSQSEAGEIPSVVPNLPSLTGPDGGPAWADAAIICPWTIYQCYGDTVLLVRHYDMMCKFVAWMEKTSRNYIRVYPDYDAFQGYGDWLSINAETTNDIIGTAYLAYCARLLSKIASAIGKNDDAKKYDTLFTKVREAFQRRFVTPEGVVASQSQTAYILALHFDLLPKELRARAADALALDIKRRGNHLSAGFVGSSYLPWALSENGKLDVAFELLNQKGWPSWLYAVTQGATTIWERWDGWTHDKGFQDVGMNSFNHYAYGAIGHWLYARVAGIDTATDKPGYKHIVIRPAQGGGLSYAKASLASVYGPIESGWRLENGKLIISVTVPANTTATVYVPAASVDTVTEGGSPAAKAAGVTSARMEAGAAVFEVGAGTYEFRA